MKNHRFILQPFAGMKTRFQCPECQHREKTFVRYIDKETSEHIDPSVGRCNREDSCGYHLTPKQFFRDNQIPVEAPHRHTKPKSSIQPRPISLIPVDTFKASLTEYDQNHLVNFLSN